MCLTNNKDLAVFNGQQFTVLSARQDGIGWELDVLQDDGERRSINAYADGFLGRDTEAGAKDAGLGFKGGRMLATFAQAITAHKSQGSEWPHVYVVNEMRPMFAHEARRGRDHALSMCRKWLYTSVTRASQGVTITAPGRS